jgi:hypothetical protein
LCYFAAAAASLGTIASAVLVDLAVGGTMSLSALLAK